ncbi:ATP-binding protein [Streptomyces anulatus]|uniref:ATP-binding protein n=1 Tax=Streptomyces anulatus TaxID=1892 RepID=UPI003673892C
MAGPPPEEDSEASSPACAAARTGTGLPLVRRIAEAHRGSLTVRAHPGGGAEFVLMIGRP